jgi:hypothetical protein
MRKKASMSLSVNAIVVLVLAFALLGVGIVFVNFLKNTLFEQTGTALGLHQLENPPSHDRPLTFPETINVRQGGRASFQVGFYNKESFQVEDATVRISKCIKAGENDPMDSEPEVTTLKYDELGPSEAVGYKIYVDLTDDPIKSDYVKSEYICTIQIYKTGSDDDYASKSFFLNVV